MAYLGDYKEDYSTLNFKFATKNTSDVPATLTGATFVVYAGSSTTEISTGETLVADFDSVTGLNAITIDLSADALYVTGQDYQVVCSVGTVNSVSYVGTVVAEFSIENRLGAKVATVDVIDDLTHYVEGRRSRSVIEVNQGFAGTLKLVPDLVPESTISTVDAVTMTGAASVTTSNLRVTANQKSALYTVPALSTLGTYTIKATVTTVDSQTLILTGTVIVY